MPEVTIKYPKHFLVILNQVFEVESKLRKIQETNSIQRNVDRLKDFFATEALTDGQGLVYHNPINENYDETRTDCEASISGSSHENLEVIEVLKPIIYWKYGDRKIIIQKAVVIVQTKNINQK